MSAKAQDLNLPGLRERLEAVAKGAQPSDVYDATWCLEPARAFRADLAALLSAAEEWERIAYDEAARRRNVAEQLQASELRAQQAEARVEEFLALSSLPEEGFSSRGLDQHLCAESGWRPIADAPRDGTKIWAYQQRRGYPEQLVVWWQYFDSDDIYDWTDEADSEPNPTHWRLLPEPPSPTGSGSQRGVGG